MQVQQKLSNKIVHYPSSNLAIRCIFELSLKSAYELRILLLQSNVKHLIERFKFPQLLLKCVRLRTRPLLPCLLSLFLCSVFKVQFLHLQVVENNGFEPLTSWMQIRRSPSWANPPCLWWARVGSNHRPYDYQSYALASWATGPSHRIQVYPQNWTM